MERYGPGKAGRSEFIAYVKGLVQEVDIILLQEITTKDQSLLELLVPEGYTYVASSRLGSSSYKEQYMYVFKNSISLIDNFVSAYDGECGSEEASEQGENENSQINRDNGSSCTSDGYNCGFDLYVTDGGQCRARNKEGSNKRVRNCCCGF